MSAEISIMNKEAIALAADSAVTMESKQLGQIQQKIFTSANKLFTLSKYHPVGIMIYGNAIFMGIPWETIIKIFRTKLKKHKFDSLEEYADEFINFLDHDNELIPDNIQHNYLTSILRVYFDFIKKGINEKIEQFFHEKGKIDEDEIENITIEEINKHLKIWDSADIIPSLDKKFVEEILKKNKKLIGKFIKEIFENLKIDKKLEENLRKIAASLFCKFPKYIDSLYSGVVIAGFGEKETFPSLKSFMIEGIVNNRLKYRLHQHTIINFDEPVSINAFAQREMVVTFMEGIDPYYEHNQQLYLEDILNKSIDSVINTLDKYNTSEKKEIQNKMNVIKSTIHKDFIDKFKLYKKEVHIDPIVNVVSNLPKEELAIMAEVLVNITSFKRKFALGSETVGGPIDVAVISKGDGFVWIKRKHYFNSELNPYFIKNYFNEYNE